MKRFIVTILILLFLPNSVVAATKRKSVKDGNKLYQEDKFDQALEKYREALEKDPDSDIINFDFGAALYKKKNYDESIGHFQKSLLTENEKIKEKTHYNLGNALYKSGIEKEGKEIQAAVNSLKQSITEYEKALNLNKENKDALYNHQFVTNELKRLEEKLQKQNQQQQNQKDESKKSDRQEQQKQEKQENKSAQDKQGAEQKQEQDSSSEQGEKEQENKSSQSEVPEAGGHDKKQDMKETSSQEMSRKEAEMLLEGYKQNEDPRKLLNFLRHKGSEQPVLKDW